MNATTWDISKIRQDFPILNVSVYGKKLVYLDNAATTQKPKQVIDELAAYYREYNSNVHRGVHFLSQKATDRQESARRSVASFINALHDHEVVFTRGTTESINLVASGFGRRFLKAGDEVLITAMEHHSNIVPWQMACEVSGATLKVVPLNPDGTLQEEQWDELLTSHTKIVALTWVSNSLGTVNDLAPVIEKAHALGVPVLVDAAQAVQHLPVDVQQLDVDFLAFSGHKIYGPTGIGVLYGKEKWLDELPPYQGGGSMIKTVTFDQTTYADLPFKFEAGTPDISGAIGLAAALDYVRQIGLQAIIDAETELMRYAAQRLEEVPGLYFVGSAPHKAGAHSFLIKGIHPFDLGEILDKQGVAVRTGHHCCQPVMDHYQVPGTVRASFAAYNTKEEVDMLVTGILRGIRMLVG